MTFREILRAMDSEALTSLERLLRATMQRATSNVALFILSEQHRDTCSELDARAGEWNH